MVDELSVVIDGLQMEARQLKSVKARESANQGIKELAAFIDQLSDGSHGSAAPGERLLCTCVGSTFIDPCHVDMHCMESQSRLSCMPEQCCCVMCNMPSDLSIVT